MPGKLKLAQCDGCGKVFKVEAAFEEYSINHDLNHGNTIERKVYRFCPECQMEIKQLLRNLGKKE